MIERVNHILSNNLHNYALCLVLVLEAACVIIVLLFPNDIRLQMAKDVGGLVAMVMGIVGGVHGWKAVKGATDAPKDPQP